MSGDARLTPEELAERHPVLFHVTEEAGLPSLHSHGLLSTEHLLRLFEIEESRATKLLTERRPKMVVLNHPLYGHAVLNDNRPISDNMLLKCLDDGLLPADWMRMLNARVFFWPSRDKSNSLIEAQENNGRAKVVMEIDTLSLAKAHGERMQLAPINTGSATRRPARRGLSTYTPLLSLSYSDWQKKRGGRDRLVEVVVVGSVPDLASHLKSIKRITGGAS
jgi:hypothetical protein